MGILTASEMCDEIRLHLGEKQAADWPNDTRCERRLNESLLHLTSPRVYRHRELETIYTDTIATSQNLFTMTGGSELIRGVHSVVLVSPTDPTDRQRLHPISERDAHALTDRYTDNRPRWYSWYDTQTIELFPAPSAQYNGWTISVRRFMSPTMFDLTGSPSAVSPISVDWDEVIILGAVWRSWRVLKEWKLAEATKAETGQLINEIANRMSVEAEDFDHIVDMHQPLFD